MIRQLLILAVVVSLAYGHSACPALWTHFSGHCFKFFPDALRKADAETTCGQFAPCSGSGLGNLAISDNPRVLDFLKSYTNQFTNNNPAGFEVWIGASDAVRETVWTTGDGRTLTSTRWAQGQPDNGRNSGQGPENCATMNSVSGLWSDVSCQSMNRYLCMMPAEVERRPFPGYPQWPNQPPMTPGMNPNTPTNPGQFPGQNPGQFPGQNPGQFPGQNPGQNPGFPGQNPGFPGQNPGQPQNPI